MTRDFTHPRTILTAVLIVGILWAICWGLPALAFAMWGQQK